MARQKSRRDENFPVGSLLIAPHLRADVHAYYNFARTADDIADSSNLAAQEKTSRLNALDETLTSGSAPAAMSAADKEIAIELLSRFQSKELPMSLAADLLIAFRKDAENHTCRTWAELIDYCRFSACPVGRFLLTLHGEDAGLAESDALCTALQILNHIQDARDDWANIKRVYIPMDWLSAADLEPDALLAPTTNSALAEILQRMLRNTELIIDQAQPLPKMIRNRGLAAEADFCLTLARRLCMRLKHGDPVAARIQLSAFDWLAAGTRGLARVLRP